MNMKHLHKIQLHIFQVKERGIPIFQEVWERGHGTLDLQVCILTARSDPPNKAGFRILKPEMKTITVSLLVRLWYVIRY